MAKWEQLIAARERKHLSQAEAAEQLNVGIVTYQRWEAGNTRPQPQHMRQLCEVFEILLQQYGETALLKRCTCSPTLVPASRDMPFEGVCTECLDKPQAFITTHLTTHLWSLAFLDHPSAQQKRSAIRQAIKDFDHMNSTNPNYQINRREALCSLATLPLITLGLTIPEKIVSWRKRHRIIPCQRANETRCFTTRKASHGAGVMQ